MFKLIATYTGTQGREVKLVFEAAKLNAVKTDLENMANYPKERPVGWPLQFSMCRYELRAVREIKSTTKQNQTYEQTLITKATLNTLLTYIGELEEAL